MRITNQSTLISILITKMKLWVTSLWIKVKMRWILILRKSKKMVKAIVLLQVMIIQISRKISKVVKMSLKKRECFLKCYLALLVQKYHLLTILQSLKKQIWKSRNCKSKSLEKKSILEGKMIWDTQKISTMKSIWRTCNLYICHP